MENKLTKFAMGVVGLYMVGRLVLPGRQSAQIIAATGNSFSMAIKAATGETAIRKRERRALQLLGDMNDEEMTYLFAGLTDQDLDWIEEQLQI